MTNSASEQIRKEIYTTRTNASTPKEQPAVNSTTTNLIKSSAAVYRSQNSSYKASDEDKKAFAEAQKRVATKRGIIPDGDGKYKQEHLDKELSPLNVIKELSSEHYKASVGRDKDEIYNEVSDAFNSVYDNESDNKEDHVPEELTSINDGLKSRTVLTDTDFLALSEKEHLKGLGDNETERDHLTKLLEDQKAGKQNVPEIKQGKDPGNKKPKGEDNKTKEKDIIDFMMNLMLDGLDWVGNKAVEGVVGAGWLVVGGSVKGIKKAGQAAYQKYKEKSEAKKANKAEETSLQTETPAETKTNQDFLKSTLAEFDKEKERSTQNLENEEYNECFSYFEDLISRKMALTSNGYVKDGSFHPYSELSQNRTDEEAEKDLAIIRNGLDFFAINDLNEKLNPNKDQKTATALTEWYSYTTTNKERETEGKSPLQFEFPEVLKKQGLTEEGVNEQIASSQEKAVAIQKFTPIVSKVKDSTDIFATNYATYKILEDTRSGKDFDSVAVEKYKKEGQLLMLQNYQNLRNGHEDALSPETMLEFSEEMCTKSRELYEKGDKETKSRDLFEDRRNSLDDTTPKNLQDFCDEMTLDDWSKMERESLDKLNKEIGYMEKNKDLNDSRRANIEKTKARILQREEASRDTENYTTTKNIGQQKLFKSGNNK